MPATVLGAEAICDPNNAFVLRTHVYWSEQKIIFFFWPCLTVCGTLVPGPGMEPVPTAVEARSPNHWTTREFPQIVFFFKKAATNTLVSDDKPNERK